ncbi:unnamed protein product [Ambrosiozyma monospora]|uniref:Unnamed protein product n=1 Tax=Ambrosiozyma monospora TaxID=43982 RepID=A0ACB5SYB5_AMBMO|nr:unnamed protein product [Ambrosiozyma monospora]
MNSTHSKKGLHHGSYSDPGFQSPSQGDESESTSRQPVINNQDMMLEHFLPSFEMHNYMFNRTLLDTEYIRDEPPPPYEESEAFQQSGTPEISRLAVAGYMDPTENPDMLVLNNLDNLQALDLPIKLTIVLTKKPPLRNVRSERESPLKVYKPGDVVAGYMLVENIWKDPIPFEMVWVTLEGTATIKSYLTPNEGKKLIRTNFLKMCDLCASHHYGFIDVGPTGDRCGKNNCPETGARYGLPDDKILKPGKKYKKLFMFKMPYTLLDTDCEHQIPEHLGLPSSFGVDIESFSGQANKIQVDKQSGYGDLGCSGSPIRTNDFSLYGQSISYSINIKIIGRQIDFYKQFYTYSTNHNFDFVLIKNAQHFFRFSTAGTNCNINSDSAWFFKSHFSSDEQIGQLEKIFADITEKLKLKRALIDAGVTDPSEQQVITDDFNTDYKKKNQLANVPRFNSVKSGDKNIVKNVTSATLTKGFINKTEVGELNIALSTNKRNSIDSIVPDVLMKSFTSDSATNSTGFSHLKANIPKMSYSQFSKSHKSVPPSSTKSSKPSKSTRNKHFINTIFSSASTSLSRSSKSVRQIFHTNSSKIKTLPYSSLEIDSNKANSNLVPFSTYLSPLFSNLLPVSLKDRSTFNEFEIELTFNPNRHSCSAQPPKSIKINPRLQVITIQSEKPIPITIDGECLMESSALETTRKKFDLLKQRLMKKYLTNWCKLLNESNGQLSVPKNVYNDLLALVKMQVRQPCGANGGLDVFETVECNNLMWTKDSEGGVYQAQLKFMLLLDEEKLTQTTGDVNEAAGLAHLVPSFQTCLLGRFYSVRFEFECGSVHEGRYGVKDAKKIFATLPIVVV